MGEQSGLIYPNIGDWEQARRILAPPGKRRKPTAEESRSEPVHCGRQEVMRPGSRIWGLVNGAGPHRNVPRDLEGQRETIHPPPPPSPTEVWILLRTIGRIRNRGPYPTMFMIMNGFLAKLRKVIPCFQYDRLWKSLKIPSSKERTHDVYDRKGIRRKVGKAGLLFSIQYGQENDVNWAVFGVKPTMCMATKDLGQNRRRSTILYLIENRELSSLALKMNGLRTHDVLDGQGLRAKWYFSPISYVIENKLRRALALKNYGRGTRDVYEAKWFSPRLVFVDSSHARRFCSLDVASS
jgi:hypothetical protein